MRCVCHIAMSGWTMTIVHCVSISNFCSFSAIHETSFIVFMVCAMLYMFLSCVLFKLITVDPMSIEVWTLFYWVSFVNIILKKMVTLP